VLILLFVLEFKKWMDEVGIIAPRIEFPVLYGPEKLVGCGCKEDIGVCDAFCFIPAKVMLRSDRVPTGEIGHVISKP
jgi:hypothetical protein